MEEIFYKLMTKLANDLYESEAYKNFLIAEKDIDNDEVKILSYKKDMAIMNYEDALRHYGKNSSFTLNESKKMSKAIFELNNNLKVKNYNISLAHLNALYKYIFEEIFSFL